MTQDEIIEMARQAGVRDDEQIFEFSQYKYLEAFAKLVAEEAAAKEREEFAVHAIDIARRAIAKEREACAQICLNAAAHLQKFSAGGLACCEAIRARGET
jgi:hypothetical protein